jgi:hypothetical protein
MVVAQQRPTPGSPATERTFGSHLEKLKHTLVSQPHHWHSPSMTTEAATASALKDFTPFQKGQVWKIGELNVAVTSVGKTLVHHKKYKRQPRGIQTTMTSKSDLQKYLLSNNAVLVAE